MPALRPGWLRSGVSRPGGTTIADRLDPAGIYTGQGIICEDDGRMDAASSISVICEFILGLLLFFVSIVWLVFPFIVMNRMRGIREEVEKSNEILVRIADGIDRAATAAPVPRTAPTTRIVATSPSISTLRPVASKIHISKDDQDLGEMDIATVKTMLHGGQLTLQDQYFDTEIKEWVTLDCHPEFC